MESSEFLSILLDLNSHFWLSQQTVKDQYPRELNDILKKVLAAINIFLTENMDNRIAFYVYNFDLRFVCRFYFYNNRELVFPLNAKDENTMDIMDF